MKKIHFINLSPKESGFTKNIMSYLNYIFKDSKYEITEDKINCDIYFFIFQNTSMMDNSIFAEYDENIDINKIKNNGYLYRCISRFICNNPKKNFISYTRSDQCDIPDYLIHHFLKHDNFKLLIKDYLSNYFNMKDSFISCLKILEDNKEIQKYFDISKMPSVNYTKTYYKKSLEDYKDKLYLFHLIPNQYSFFTINKNDSKFYLFNSRIVSPVCTKIYDVFYCKHQRHTIDGIARRYLFDIAIPNIKKNIPNVQSYESLQYDEYWNILSKSKICISPYGLGERVDDDTKANLCETIVIKPICDYVYDYFNTFTSEKFNKHHKVNFTSCIVYCKSDYSDLLDVIKKVLDNYDYYLNRVKKCKKEYIEYITSTKYICDFIGTLDDVLD